MHVLLFRTSAGRLFCHLLHNVWLLILFRADFTLANVLKRIRWMVWRWFGVLNLKYLGSRKNRTHISLILKPLYKIYLVLFLLISVATAINPIINPQSGRIWLLIFLIYSSFLMRKFDPDVNHLQSSWKCLKHLKTCRNYNSTFPWKFTTIMQNKIITLKQTKVTATVICLPT